MFKLIIICIKEQYKKVKKVISISIITVLYDQWLVESTDGEELKLQGANYKF